MRAENYDLARQPSFEYANFYRTLTGLKYVKAIEVPYDDILNLGRREFNRRLLALVEREKPDMFFAFMFFMISDKISSEPETSAFKIKLKTKFSFS